jgi:hypothetical protein
MKMRIIILIALLFLPSLGLADQVGWTDRNGNRIENRENKKSINGFGGWLLITSDQDWKEKWESPEQAPPVFTSAERIGLGDKITILTLYINPQVDSENMISLSCDIIITQPDGTPSYDETNLECANEKLVGPSNNVRLTYLIIDFIAELSDPYGTWTIEIVLKDRNSGIEIPLKSSFELVNRSTLTLQQNTR